MGSNQSALALLCAFCSLILSFNSKAESLDQGLDSIIQIIDRALADLNKPNGSSGQTGEAETAAKAAANTTIVNLSRTLGTLSFSRLQCGEAEVLAAFTRRVQLMPAKMQDEMRSAFQAGFDKSKNETALLSEDECQRLTQSRKQVETNVKEVDQSTVKAKQAPKVEKPPEDLKLSHMRIAELSGQLAYKHQFCAGDEMFDRSYNAFINTVPQEFRKAAKAAYWKGFKHGERLNKNLTIEQC